MRKARTALGQRQFVKRRSRGLMRCHENQPGLFGSLYRFADICCLMVAGHGLTIDGSIARLITIPAPSACDLTCHSRRSPSISFQDYVIAADSPIGEGFKREVYICIKCRLVDDSNVRIQIHVHIPRHGAIESAPWLEIDLPVR